MVAVWTHALMSAAEISNLFSVIGVVVCFVCMVTFILRVQGVQMPSSSVVHVGQPAAVQVDLQKIPIPFTCVIHSTKKKPADELELELTLESECCCQIMWNVSVPNLKSLIHMPWSAFYKNLTNNDVMLYEKIEEPSYYKPKSKENFALKLVRPSTLNKLGKPPRYHFPLVIFLFNPSAQEYIDSTVVGALITIIHLPDEDCPMPSSILYQYLKQYSGQLTQLKVLYTQHCEKKEAVEDVSEAQRKEEEKTSEFDGLSSEGNCVVCQCNVPTRALLPCRHVCVCAVCSPHVQHCPLCRTRINAFFLTEPQHEQHQLQQEVHEVQQEQEVLRRHRSFLTNMNSILHNVLGNDNL